MLYDEKGMQLDKLHMRQPVSMTDWLYHPNTCDAPLEEGHHIYWDDIVTSTTSSSDSQVVTSQDAGGLTDLWLVFVGCPTCWAHVGAW